MQPAVVHVTEVGVPSDMALVLRARDGDVSAFDSIASGRLPGAYRLAAAILGREAEAADATQEALVAAWRELPQLRDPDRFDAWFRQILVDQCRMTIRRRDRAGLDPLDAELAALATGSGRRARPVVDNLGVRPLLQEAFEQLDADDRIALALRYLEGAPAAEIAQVVHLPVGTVKWRLHEACAAMIRALEAIE